MRKETRKILSTTYCTSHNTVSMDLKYRHLTFFMNKLSCLEHLSTLSFSTEMSEMMLHGNKEMRTAKLSFKHYN